MAATTSPVDLELAHHDGRVKRTKELDDAIAAWTTQHNLEDVLAVLDRAEVPAGKIYDIADITSDPHYIKAREMIQQFELPDGCLLKLPGIVPKLSQTLGKIHWVGPRLGEHTTEILSSLGYNQTAQLVLKQQGVI